VSYVDGSYKCGSQCYGFQCNGTNWTCFQQGDDTNDSYCRLGCTADTDCAKGQRCTIFTGDAPDIDFEELFCAKPCGMAGCSTAEDDTGMTGDCTCGMDGSCAAMGTACYQVSTNYGL
jgi:hypothetical protein